MIPSVVALKVDATEVSSMFGHCASAPVRAQSSDIFSCKTPPVQVLCFETAELGDATSLLVSTQQTQDDPAMQTNLSCSKVMASLQSVARTLHELKTEHQYLGRYSIDKLNAFHQYQQTTSINRVAAVIVFSPLPTLLILVCIDSFPLQDPRLGVNHQAVAFLRSAVSHGIMTYLMLLAGRQATGLTAMNSNYTCGNCILVAIAVAVCLETLWVTVAVGWMFPVPMRELTGVLPWGMLLALFNYLLAKNDLTRVRTKLKRYIPVIGAQLVLFYFLLGLSIVFAYVPYPAQLAMIFVFPVLKITIKRQLWKFSRELDDISADVTICMVEISGSLYQTVCMQYVQSNLMVLLIMVMDFAQAAIESRTYLNHEYIGDTRSTLNTAVKIVEAGVAGQRRGFHTTPGTTAHKGVQVVTNDSNAAAASMSKYSHSRAWSIHPRRVWEALLQQIESIWRRWKYRGRRRKHRYIVEVSSDLSTTQGTTSERKKSTEAKAEAPLSQELEVPRSVYLQARFIRTSGSHRLISFGQVSHINTGDRASVASKVGATIGRQVTLLAGKSREHRVRRRGRSVEISAKAIAKTLGRPRSQSDVSIVNIGRKMLSRTNSIKIAATDSSLPAEYDIDNEIRRTIELSDVHPSPISAFRRLSAAGRSGIIIDNVFIQRRDQARILEQTLQMLFAAEVLLFVEYMEVFMPLLYASCVGILWQLPNAKYNVILDHMSRSQVELEVGSSIAYAALELLSFLSVYRFIKTRYGISGLYQLAFLLETHWATLQGKLIGSFISILVSATIHQGVSP